MLKNNSKNEEKEEGNEIKLEETELELEEESLKEKNQKLKNDLKKCLKEKMEYLSGWQRAKADFINAKKEEEKIKEEFIKFAEINLLKEILDVIDGFERALNDEKWNSLGKEWQDGLKNLYNSLKKILENHNIGIVKAEGEKFNPEFHEAVEIEGTKEKSEDQIIMKEIQKGYIMKEKVLRAAKVKVKVFKE